MKMNKILAGAVASIVMFGGGMFAVQSVFAPTAMAQSSAKAVVDNAIASGIVGETASGYLALISGSASPEIVNAMNEINIGRKSLYTRLAREQNVTVEVVAALTGEKQITKTAPGTKYMNSRGAWVTK